MHFHVPKQFHKFQHIRAVARLKNKRSSGSKIFLLFLLCYLKGLLCPKFGSPCHLKIEWEFQKQCLPMNICLTRISLRMKFSYDENKLLVFHLSAYATCSCSPYDMVSVLCLFQTLIGFLMKEINRERVIVVVSVYK